MPTLFATALLLFLFSTAASAKPVSVTTIEVDVQSIEERIDTVGQVESLQAPLIASEVTAKVSQILVQIGDSVTVNTPLAQLDTQTYQLNLEKAASEVARLEALVKLQNTQVKRYQTLLKRKGVDQATYDKAMAEKASLIAQKAYAQALHKEAQMTLDKTQILSPIDGVVDQRMVSVGDYVVPGAALFKLVGNHPLRVKLPFSEIYASRIHKGQKVYLTSSIQPHTPIEARISYLRPKIENQSRAVEVYALFENRHNWLPGATVHAQLQLGQQNNAQVLPVQAVVNRPAGPVVYVVHSEKPAHRASKKTFYRVEERPVTTGLRVANRVHILSGLHGNERIVMDGAGFLTDGAEIEIHP